MDRRDLLRLLGLSALAGVTGYRRLSASPRVAAPRDRPRPAPGSCPTSTWF